MIVWERAEGTEVIKVGWRTVVRKLFKQPSGSVQAYETFGKETDRHAGVIAVTADKKVIVAEQFRPGPEQVMQELTGGNVDGDEDPKMAAMRELREEAGYVSDDVLFLGEARKDAYMNATWYYYLARNCHKLHDQVLDDTEFINIRLVSIDEFISNAKKNKMTDHAAVLMAYDELLKIKKGTK